MQTAGQLGKNLGVQVGIAVVKKLKSIDDNFMKLDLKVILYLWM